jgi:3-dehydroquinate synthetase
MTDLGAPIRAIHVAGGAADPRGYDVRIGPGALAGLADAVAGRAAFVVTDANVARHHAERLGALADAPRATLAPGEEAKGFGVLAELCERIAAAGLGRDGVVVAFGGGAVGDVAGLAAALYARGIAWIACPTTLLAQVDASVGGKTAVNLRAGKNLAGAFHPPCAVLADVDVLATLPAAELRSGLGELAKAALIAGGELLARLEAAGEPATWDAATRTELIALAVAAKAAVVAADLREAGPREVLNLGHTFAHAIEHAAGYGRVPHGVAVAAGIGLALDAARRLALPVQPSFDERVRALLRRLGLPAGLAELDLGLDADALVRGIAADKKRRGGATRLVVPLGPGDVRRGVAVDDAFLRALLVSTG